MGASSSKIEDDKALILCRERKRFVKQALDERCSLAVAHVAYIQSLRNIGTAFGKFVEPGVPRESSLYTTSTSVIPEPPALIEKSNSQFTIPSPSPSQNVETSEHLFSVPLPPSGMFHVSHMKSGKASSRTVKERLPAVVTATVSLSDETFEAPPPPDTPTWDYFGLRDEDEKGIPELEEAGEKGSGYRRGEDSTESDDEFDQPPSESLVRMFKNRNDESLGTVASETEQQNGGNDQYETDGTSQMAPSKTTSSVVPLLTDGREKGLPSESKVPRKDFFLCMKDIEDLLLKASDSGREVLRMLEANKVHFRPLFAEETAHKSMVSARFTACFSCCAEETQFPQAPPPNWHRSVSSRSSPSRYLGLTSIDNTENHDNNLFSDICMNSGSHAATLDRLYAWERKLYDEVKASGTIRREYDIKCNLLRHQDSRGESQYKIDRTRASIKDLHSRIRVAIHRIDSISKKIEEIRDKELQPQLEELIGGFARMWTTMLDCHKRQYEIISTSSTNGGAEISALRSEAAGLLQLELTALSSSFTKWVAAHKSYLQSVNEWLLKCVILNSVQHKPSRRRNSQFSPRRDIAPPIFVTCRDWIRLLEQAPTEELVDSIKDLVDVATHFFPQQEELHRNETSADLSPNYDNLRLGTAALLDQLKSFAQASVAKHEGLQKAIQESRAAYERPAARS